MSSLAPARAAIRAFIETGFTALPMVWPNERAPMNSTPTAFVAVEVMGAGNTIKGIGQPGNRLFIHVGVIMAHIFVPFGTGSAAADSHAEALAGLLTRKDIPAPTAPSMVRTEDASSYDGELGSEDGNYWRVTVSVPFDFYHFG